MSFSEINAPLFDRLQDLKLNDMFCFVYECTNNIAPVDFRNYQSMKNDLYAVPVTQLSVGSDLSIILQYDFGTLSPYGN